MARARGTFNIYSNYDVSVKKPFDARMLVSTYADLTTKSNWYLFDAETNTLTTTFIAYNGMIVAVADKNDLVNSGLYMLFDPASTKNPNVENELNWHKICETSEVDDFVNDFTARLKTINDELSDIKDRLAALEAERTHFYSYRNGFPTEGIQDHFYVAEKEHRTWLWSNGRYVHIADRFDSEDHDNNPDTPEVRIIHGGSTTMF